MQIIGYSRYLNNEIGIDQYTYRFMIYCIFGNLLAIILKKVQSSHKVREIVTLLATNEIIKEIDYDILSCI